MIDRQDIDALLIGALYGELTPADEARLTTHLESHPADRTALAGLTSTRQAVRESRIFQVQLDPPQSVSALLLQEAARRAPRRAPVRDEQESWFHRFVHSFMAHPAMAAAAMLVLVVGIAGTMYMRNGDQFAERDIAAPAAPAATAQAQGSSTITTKTATLPADVAEDKTNLPVNRKADELNQVSATAATGSGYRVDLATQKDVDRPRARNGEAYKGAAPAKEAALDSKKQLLEVRTPEPTPKDMDQKPKAKVADKNEEQEVADNGVAGNANTKSPGSGAMAGMAKPTVAHTAPPPTTPQAPTADPARSESSADSLLAWAKDQHTRIKQLARAGNCNEVAKLATSLSTRAPDYYAANVAPDRELKQCMAYINDARNSDAEKSAKLRAQKRNSVDEPAPAPAEVTH